MSRRRFKSSAALSAFLLLLWGCEDAPVQDVAVPPPVIAETGDDSLPAAPGAPAAGSVAVPENPYAVLAIEGEGLRVFSFGSGSSRALPFGTSYDIIRSAVSTTIGSEPIEEGNSVDCGTRYARWPGDFTTSFIENHFVGWFLGPDDATLSTASGVGVGSTRSEVESVYNIEVFESTLGLEFVTGGLAGLLDGQGDEATVTHLWAGQACIAR